MKTLITYSSKTGNTEKVAKAIQKGIENSQCVKIAEIENLDNFDLIVLGGWIDKGSLNSEALELIEKLKNRKIAFFFTLGAYADSDHSKDCTNNILNLLKENGNEIIGSYCCQGAIDPKLIEFMSKLPQDHIMAPNPERIARWKAAESHPDEEDLVNAENFGKSLK